MPPENKRFIFHFKVLLSSLASRASGADVRGPAPGSPTKNGVPGEMRKV